MLQICQSVQCLQLLKSWKYSSLKQRNPKTVNHGKRQRQIKTTKATELKACKQA